LGRHRQGKPVLLRSTLQLASDPAIAQGYDAENIDSQSVNTRQAGEVIGGCTSEILYSTITKKQWKWIEGVYRQCGITPVSGDSVKGESVD
jgi:hypothetical protein